MKKQFKLGVIGCGSTAQTILKGVVLSDFLNEKKIIVSDISEERLDEVDALGVRLTLDNKFVAENSEYLIIAVNAKNFEAVIRSLSGYNPEKIISVMNCVKKNVIKNAFGTSAVKVARCILNLPCSIGSGAIGIDMSDFNKNNDDTDFISNVFNCVGAVLSIDESKLDAVSGINVGGPAYTFMLIDSLIDAGIKNGLTKNEAKLLAVQTVIGSAEMIENSDQSVAELLKTSCQAGSAVLGAVKVLEDNNYRGIISQAVTACVNRTKELSE